MHLMTCRPRGHQFIMANKTDLEYIMFPVNVMPRHQRPERTGSKNTEQSFRANECKKGDLLSDTQNQTCLDDLSEQR